MAKKLVMITSRNVKYIKTLKPLAVLF